MCQITCVIWYFPESGFPTACHEKDAQPITQMHIEEGLLIGEEFQANSFEEAFKYHKKVMEDFFACEKSGEPWVWSNLNKE